MASPVVGSQIIGSIASAAPQFSSRTDVLAFALHCFMRLREFRFIGLGESGDTTSNCDDNKEILSLPSDWNSSQDLYGFRYTHPRSSLVFLVKALLVGPGCLLVAAVPLEDPRSVHSVQVLVDDHVSKTAPLDHYSCLLTSPDALVDTFEGLIAALLPVHDKVSSSTNAVSSSGTCGNQPANSGDDDPLRVSPLFDNRRRPQRPQPFDPDRFPVSGPFFVPEGVARPYGGVRPGGNLVGPGHPLFGGVPAAPNLRIPPGHPSGARYDPMTPFGLLPEVPDHLPPPGQGFNPNPGGFNSFGPFI